MPLWVFFKRMVEATHPPQVVPAIPVSWNASSPLVLPYFSPGADWCPAKPPSLVSCPGHPRVATSTQSGGPGPAAGHTTAGCAEASSSRALGGRHPLWGLAYLPPTSIGLMGVPFYPRSCWGASEALLLLPSPWQAMVTC